MATKWRSLANQIISNHINGLEGDLHDLPPPGDASSNELTISNFYQLKHSYNCKRTYKEPLDLLQDDLELT